MGKRRKLIIAWLLILSMIAPVFPPIHRSQAADTAIEMDYNRMTIEELLDSETALTWVFTGDSITHNANWTQGMNSYSEWFEQYLYDTGRRDDSVILTAWGGSETYDFQTQETENSTKGTDNDIFNGQGSRADAGMGLEQMVLKYNPDVVFIKLGMNDGNKDQETFEKYYNQMLDDIYASGAENGKKPKIVILSPTPHSGETIYSKEEEDKDSSYRFRNYLKGIAEERGVLFCDLATAFMEEALALGADYSHTFFSDPSDGAIHPNAAGQYFLFRTLSKTLGIYDEAMPLYQLKYEDLNDAALYAEDTYIGKAAAYSNAYDSVGDAISEDDSEIDKTMPTLSQAADANLLASIDFTSKNKKKSGYFNGGSTYAEGTRVSLMDAEVCEDPLTLKEVQGLENEFSIVFRAKLEKGSNPNQPLLYLSPSGTASWTNALAVGAPCTSHECYYRVANMTVDSKSVTSKRIQLDGSTPVNAWHTIAIVQSADQFIYYVDGKAVSTKNVKLKDGCSIGTGFENATNFTAYIGSYTAASSYDSYQLKGKFDYFQLYGSALSGKQVKELAGEETDKVEWSQTVKENNVWVIAGGDQMSGYDGAVVNRSLYRHIDNILRCATCTATGVNNENCRDNRTISVAAPGRTVSELNGKYDTLVARHDHQVFLLLPEVSQVYGDNYQHSQTAVAEYKASVQELLRREKENGSIRILWTPLASREDAINAWLNDYAQAIREIAASDNSILFFDANRFMKEKMSANESLKRNWFEDDMYISPLAAVDLTYAFYCCMKTMNTGNMEVLAHNLRETTDARIFKGAYVRDYIAAEVKVSGTAVTVNTATIKAAYPKLAKLRLVLTPGPGTGNYHEKLRELSEVTEVTEQEGIYTFEAPCSNPVLAVYGEQDGKIYRFKDLAVKVTTTATLSEETADPDGAYLDSLEVVGAPAIAFEKDKTTYAVTLYQYQRNVQIRAKAQMGLQITVNGTEVKSGAYSELISVDKSVNVTVKVSGTVSGSAAEKTYTMQLARQEIPDIIITEVMTDGYYQYETIDGQTNYGDDNYDLIEIYNASGRDLDLKDYSIGYKTDYPYTNQTVSQGQWPYYFTGNDQAFQCTSAAVTTYTGINPITKYSSYWQGGSNPEPESVLFKADSTMVIWVKFTREGDSDTYGETLTYDTLRNALEAHKGTHTLTVDIDGADTAVVPGEEQLVVAEVPKGTYAESQTPRARTATADKAVKNFYLESDEVHTASSSGTARNWLFILKDSAAQAQNGAITEAGDDIISAARYVRPGRLVGGVAEGSTDKLSSVFSFDYERGMSLVKNEGYWNLFSIGKANTSDEQGYSNLTSFGAIEYWQKPLRFSDDTPAVVENRTPKEVKKGEQATVSLNVTDDTDIRYMELYVRKAGEKDFIRITRDLVLEAGVKNAGISEAITQLEYQYDLGTISGQAEYYGLVLDGNLQETRIGSKEAPEKIAIEGEKPEAPEEPEPTEEREGYFPAEVLYEKGRPVWSNSSSSTAKLGEELTATGVVYDYTGQRATSLKSVYVEDIALAPEKFDTMTVRIRSVDGTLFTRFRLYLLGKNGGALTNQTGLTVDTDNLNIDCITVGHPDEEGWITVAIDVSSLELWKNAGVIKGFNFGYVNTGVKQEIAEIEFTKAPPEAYDISDYRGGSAYTYPYKEGYVFAGWYTDEALTVPLGKNVKNGKAYAKFVDERVLSVKCQLSANVSAFDEKTNLRVLTSVDSLNYETVGFTIKVGNIRTFTPVTNKVYRTVLAVENAMETYSYDAGTAFENSESEFFMAYTLIGIPNGVFDENITAIPTWTTLDGTIVTGVVKEFTIREAIINLSGSRD